MREREEKESGEGERDLALPFSTAPCPGHTPAWGGNTSNFKARLKLHGHAGYKSP